MDRSLYIFLFFLFNANTSLNAFQSTNKFTHPIFVGCSPPIFIIFNCRCLSRPPDPCDTKIFICVNYSATYCFMASKGKGIEDATTPLEPIWRTRCPCSQLKNMLCCPVSFCNDRRTSVYDVIGIKTATLAGPRNTQTERSLRYLLDDNE